MAAVIKIVFTMAPGHLIVHAIQATLRPEMIALQSTTVLRSMEVVVRIALVLGLALPLALATQAIIKTEIVVFR